MSALFSNPTMLIILALGAALLLGGGGGALNPTELILSLLRGLKLIPQAQSPPSEQVYQGYVRRAWQKLREGQLEQSRSLLDAAIQESEQRLSEEQAVAPAGISTILQEWLKSPIFLIAIAVGAFLIFGGGSCKQQDPQPQAPAVDVTPIRYETGETVEPYSGSHYADVQRLHLLQSGYDPASVPAIVPADHAPALPPEFDYGPWTVQTSLDADQAACLTDGPVCSRIAAAPVRVATAPVRAIVRKQPLRRVASAVHERRPLRRSVAALGQLQPLRRVAAALFGR